MFWRENLAHVAGGGSGGGDSSAGHNLSVGEVGNKTGIDLISDGEGALERSEGVLVA